MRIVFLESARRDLVWFRQYYRLVFAEGGQEGVRRFNKAVDALSAMPELGHVVEADNREYSISRTPFSIIYRLRGDRIEILRIWDHRAERRAESGVS